MTDPWLLAAVTVGLPFMEVSEAWLFSFEACVVLLCGFLLLLGAYTDWNLIYTTFRIQAMWAQLPGDWTQLLLQLWKGAWWHTMPIRSGDSLCEWKMSGEYMVLHNFIIADKLKILSTLTRIFKRLILKTYFYLIWHFKMTFVGLLLGLTILFLIEQLIRNILKCF